MVSEARDPKDREKKKKLGEIGSVCVKESNAWSGCTEMHSSTFHKREKVLTEIIKRGREREVQQNRGKTNEGKQVKNTERC